MKRSFSSISNDLTSVPETNDIPQLEPCTKRRKLTSQDVSDLHFISKIGNASKNLSNDMFFYIFLHFLSKLKNRVKVI